jgi:hypothetical protein
VLTKLISSKAGINTGGLPVNSNTMNDNVELHNEDQRMPDADLNQDTPAAKQEKPAE